MTIRSFLRCTCLASLLTVAIVVPGGAAETPPDPASANAARVRAAFEAWRNGTGSVFDLLADDVVWTVPGNSPVSGTYHSRQAFMAQAVAPINARLSTPIMPSLRHVVAQDDVIVVIWDGVATTLEGGRYRNSYAWHMVMADERIVRVSAFLDTWALAELME